MALLAFATAGCAAGEDIEVVNGADAAVMVSLGDEHLGRIGSGGGVVLLDADGCYGGPIVVAYEGGTTVELEGPICPGQTLAVERATARIVTPTGTT